MSTISEALKKAQKKRSTNESDPVTFLKDPFFKTPQKLHRFERKTPISKKNNPFLILLLFLTIGIVFLSFFFLNRVNRTINSTATALRPRTILTAPVYQKEQLAGISREAVPEKNILIEEQNISETPVPELQGIMYSDLSPQAVIDGSIYNENDIVNGFTVKKILPDKVLLQSKEKEIYQFLN